MTASAPTAITNFRYARLGDLVIEHPLWINPRTITGLADEEIEELGADVRVRGIEVPLIVQKIKHKGSVADLVLDGQRRVLGARAVWNKDAEIPVTDRSVEPIELTPEIADALMLDMLSVVERRKGLSSVELSEVAERLRNRGRKLSDIAKAIGKNEGWISKILKARSQAAPKLLLRWRKGEVTDEQFKELAEVKEPDKQAEAVEAVVKARQSGDKAEARTLAKEIKETAKREAKSKEPHLTEFGKRHAVKTDDAPPPAVKGPQEDLFEKTDKPKAAPPPKPAKKPMTARAALEDVLALADKRAPTHDYVKGLMDGIGYAVGELGPEDWGKAWRVYLARVEGSGKPAKKAKGKVAKKAKRPAKKAKTTKRRK